MRLAESKKRNKKKQMISVQIMSIWGRELGKK